MTIKNIIIVFVLLLYVGNCNAKTNSTYKSAKSTNFNTPIESLETNSSIPKSIDSFCLSPCKETKGYYEKRNNSDNCYKRIHKFIKRWNWTAIFTGILAVATILLWLSTRNLAINAQQSSENQLRAYVFASINEPFKLNKEGKLSVCVTIKNAGETPARNLQIPSTISLEHYPLKNKLVPFKQTTKPSISDLASKESVEQYFSLNLRLNETELDSITKGSSAIFVSGKVTYTDIFGKEHISNFCFYSTSESFKNREFAYYHENNTST